MVTVHAVETAHYPWAGLLRHLLGRLAFTHPASALVCPPERSSGGRPLPSSALRGRQSPAKMRNSSQCAAEPEVQKYLDLRHVVYNLSSLILGL